MTNENRLIVTGKTVPLGINFRVPIDIAFVPEKWDELKKVRGPLSHVDAALVVGCGRRIPEGLKEELEGVDQWVMIAHPVLASVAFFGTEKSAPPLQDSADALATIVLNRIISRDTRVMTATSAQFGWLGRDSRGNYRGKVAEYNLKTGELASYGVTCANRPGELPHPSEDAPGKTKLDFQYNTRPVPLRTGDISSVPGAITNEMLGRIIMHNGFSQTRLLIGMITEDGGPEFTINPDYAEAHDLFTGRGGSEVYIRSSRTNMSVRFSPTMPKYT